MVITTALMGKFILTGAAAAGAGVVIYKAARDYERSVEWQSVMDQNALFYALYSREQYNKAFGESTFSERITELKDLNRQNVISDEEFKALSVEIAKAK